MHMRVRRRGRSGKCGRGHARRGRGRARLSGSCSNGRGWLPRLIGLLCHVLPLLHHQLGAKGKEALFVDKAKGLLAIRVLESKNKGGDRPRKVRGGGTHLRGELYDL